MDRSQQKVKIQKGFTLIELLIVIVIVGILSTVIIANFVGIRARARDAERKSDLRQIQTALQLYYADYGNYPESGSAPKEFSAECAVEFSGDSVTYMREIPCDPLGSSNAYVYLPGPTGCLNTSAGGNPCVEYQLYACLENSNDSETDDNAGVDTIADCDEGRFSFTVKNP